MYNDIGVAFQSQDPTNTIMRTVQGFSLASPVTWTGMFSTFHCYLVVNMSILLLTGDCFNNKLILYHLLFQIILSLLVGRA